MSFDHRAIAECAAEGPVVLVVVAETRGSVPREVGAAMLVTEHDTIGTIGGGALEYEAIARARASLRDGHGRLDLYPLGPALGQCCGGAVTVLTEIWDADDLARLDADGGLFARPVPGAARQMPMSVRRKMAEIRNGQGGLYPVLLDGWMIEPIAEESREIWIWGAGHVGRALVDVLAPLPTLSLRWADSDANRFPAHIPAEVECCIATNPADLVPLSGTTAEHYVLTYSHTLDLEICHRVLSRPFRHLGLIGSATKRVRFRSRLAALGHGAAQIDRMTCPIGDPRFGKHPQEIALGIGAEILERGTLGAGMIGQRA